MAKRPVLKVGDVVRLSKKGLRTHRRRPEFDTMVVHKVVGPGDEGRTIVTCTYFLRKKAHRASFKRRDLWCTGYNTGVAQPKTIGSLVFAPQYADPRNGKAMSAVAPAAKPTKTNDGRTHCMSCSLPTVFIPGFGSGGYNICKNKSCKMYDT